MKIKISQMIKNIKGYSISNKRMILVLLTLAMVPLLNFWSSVFWNVKRVWMQNLFWLKSEMLLINTEGCKIPIVSPSDVRDFEDIPLICGNNKIPLIIAGNNPLAPSLLFFPNISDQYGENVSCSYDTFHRESDFHTIVKSGVKTINETTVPIEDEFIRVQCLDRYKTLVFEEFFPFIQRKPEVERRVKMKKYEKSSEKLSVLFLVIDSVSRIHYLKHMKKTDQYLRQFVPLVEMKGFNKIGKNTYPIMTAMLTGYLLNQIAKVFNISDRMPLDSLPFIWKDFAANGYRVLFSEDMPTWGTFQYKGGGFIHQPTDYYYRTFSYAYEDKKYASNKKNRKLGCLKSQPEAEVLLKWTQDFFDVFAPEPLFALTIISYLSHNSRETLYQYDDPVLAFFKHLNERHHLNRTIVFFMGDHGFRYGSARLTFFGQVDSKLPFLFILFPHWFISKYPMIVSNLKKNADRLTTVLDIHITLKDILKFPDIKFHSIRSQWPNVSLIREIVSEKRTCEKAMIPDQYCACDKKTEIPVTDVHVKLAASSLLNAINSFTKKYRAQCSFLRLDGIINAGFRTILTDDIQLGTFSYQITVRVTPGGGIFEGTVSHIREKYKADSNIERVNLFGHDADCIKNGLIRPYCHCREQKYKPS